LFPVTSFIHFGRQILLNVIVSLRNTFEQFMAKNSQQYFRCQFHQCSMSSFYMRGAQKRKKDSQVVSLFKLLGSVRAKAARKHVGEIDPRSQSYQAFLLA
jgi:hypothetical protein